jgi:phenylalanine-4-hydroxylase
VQILEGEIVTGSRNLQGEITLIRFKSTVTHGKTVLFQPEWGVMIWKESDFCFSGPM